jgi:rubrerythrin
MELKGSKTEANLNAAFAGESMARNKYTYYASQAKKEGYVQIANLFEETAFNEKEHAKIWFKLLQEAGRFRIRHQPQGCCRRRALRVDRDVIGFAKEAREEGFNKIATSLKWLLPLRSTMSSAILTS